MNDVKGEPSVDKSLRGRLGLLNEEELATALDVKAETLRVWRTNKTGPATGAVVEGAA